MSFLETAERAVLCVRGATGANAAAGATRARMARGSFMVGLVGREAEVEQHAWLRSLRCHAYLAYTWIYVDWTLQKNLQPDRFPLTKKARVMQDAGKIVDHEDGRTHPIKQPLTKPKLDLSLDQKSKAFVQSIDRSLPNNHITICKFTSQPCHVMGSNV